jgi:hypothetical protein
MTGSGILFMLLLAGVLGLMAVGSVLGFVTALFVFRRRFASALLDEIEPGLGPLAGLVTGLMIAVGLPILAAVTAALGEAQWLVPWLGMLAETLEKWVAGAYGLGLVLGATAGPRLP